MSGILNQTLYKGEDSPGNEADSTQEESESEKGLRVHAEEYKPNFPLLPSRSSLGNLLPNRPPPISITNTASGARADPSPSTKSKEITVPIRRHASDGAISRHKERWMCIAKEKAKEILPLPHTSNSNESKMKKEYPRSIGVWHDILSNKRVLHSDFAFYDPADPSLSSSSFEDSVPDDSSVAIQGIQDSLVGVSKSKDLDEGMEERFWNAIVSKDVVDLKAIMLDNEGGIRSKWMNLIFSKTTQYKGEVPKETTNFVGMKPLHVVASLGCPMCLEILLMNFLGNSNIDLRDRTTKMTGT